MPTSEQVTRVGEATDSEMVRILDELLEADENITARAVTRKHSSIKHASTITRHAGRSELLAHYQARQREFRAWLKRLPKRSSVKIASEMSQKDVRIAELERQIEVLRVSHVAMIRAVGELGGVSKWLKLFESCQDTKETLKRIGAMPAAQVVEIGKK